MSTTRKVDPRDLRPGQGLIWSYGSGYQRVQLVKSGDNLHLVKLKTGALSLALLDELLEACPNECSHPAGACPNCD